MSDAPEDDTRRSARPASVEDLKLLLASLKDEGDLDGVEVRTLDLEGLLKTKQTSRAKDQLDRIVLERALQALKGKPAGG